MPRSRRTPANATTAFGAMFSTEAAVVTLEAKHAELASHIRDDDREARELEEAMTHRDRSAVAWSNAHQGIATALEGLYRLAGWRELSERVRPTQRTLRGEEPGRRSTRVQARPAARSRRAVSRSTGRTPTKAEPG